MSSGDRTLLPPGRFSNPQSACVRTRAPGDAPSTSVCPVCLCLSPQSGFGLPFGSPSPSPGSPRTMEGQSTRRVSSHANAVRVLISGSVLTHHPFQGGSRGRAGREGPRGLGWGEGALPLMSREHPAFGMDTHVPHVRAAGPWEPRSPLALSHVPLCRARCRQPPARPSTARLALAPQPVPA